MPPGHQMQQHPRQLGPPAPPQRPPAPPARPPAPAPRRSRPLPGLGLVLTLLGLVVQVLSLTVLPLASLGGPGAAASMPEVWRAATDEGTHGFGGWYLVIFSYPLAALGVLLALVSVLESVALKMIWGGLAVLGLGILVLRYGFGPFAELVGSDPGGLHFTTQEITIATVATAALVIVVFLLRTAMSTFRRVAGLILLALGGVHLAAVSDLSRASITEGLSIGAYGPPLGYLLTAAAAFIGPGRLLRF